MKSILSFFSHKQVATIDVYFRPYNGMVEYFRELVEIVVNNAIFFNHFIEKIEEEKRS